MYVCVVCDLLYSLYQYSFGPAWRKTATPTLFRRALHTTKGDPNGCATTHPFWSPLLLVDSMLTKPKSPPPLHSLTVLNMPSSNQGWPEDFGFKMGGTGPTYILSVEEGSSAHLAGLQPGDQVLEIEGQNVSTLGAQAVAAIAQTQKNIPPSIGVVSRIQQVSHRGERLIVSLIEDNRVSFSITSSCITIFQYFFHRAEKLIIFDNKLFKQLSGCF